MRRALLISVLFVGCFNPDDIIPIRGSVDVPVQRVELLRGVTCESLTHLKDTNAADDGAYSFEVFRAQVQQLSNFGPQCVRVQADFPSGTHAESTLESVFAQTEVLHFADWKPGLSFADGTVLFAPVIVDDALVISHSIDVSDDGGVTWKQSDFVMPLEQRQPMKLDERVLNEFGGTMTIVGNYGRLGMSSLLPSTTQTGGVLVRPTDSLSFTASLVPPSRGATCDELPSPCVLTDGELVPERLSSPTLTIRFATPFAPSLIVMRDMFQLPLYGDPPLPRMHVIGLLPNDEEVELTSVPLLYDFNEGRKDLSDGGFELTGRHIAIPLENSQTLIGVKFVSSGFQRAREISVF